MERMTLIVGNDRLGKRTRAFPDGQLAYRGIPGQRHALVLVNCFAVSREGNHLHIFHSRLAQQFKGVFRRRQICPRGLRKFLSPKIFNFIVDAVPINTIQELCK